MAACVFAASHIGQWVDQKLDVLDSWTHQQLNILRSRLWDRTQSSVIVPKLSPAIQECEHMIETDPQLFMHFHKMFDEARIPKDGWNYVRI